MSVCARLGHCSVHQKLAHYNYNSSEKGKKVMFLLFPASSTFKPPKPGVASLLGKKLLVGFFPFLAHHLIGYGFNRYRAGFSPSLGQ